MGEGNSIVNFGELSKPATVLIEKVSDAVGGLCKPWQTKRVAKAEAEAEIILAQGQIEITEIQRRALERFIAEEGNKQENMEAITQKAIPLLTDSSEPEKMEDDWITNFFDKCRIISDEEMQALWARVLAGEANTPGAFAKRTVNFLGSLDKHDAGLFTNLCRFRWFVGEVVPLVYDIKASIYKDSGVNFNLLQHLDDIGLVSFGLSTGYAIAKLGGSLKTDYYGEQIMIVFKKEKDNDLGVGHIFLTKTGEELARVCDAKPVEGFMEYILDRWMKKGLSPCSPYPRIE